MAFCAKPMITGGVFYKIAKVKKISVISKKIMLKKPYSLAHSTITCSPRAVVVAKM